MCHTLDVFYRQIVERTQMDASFSSLVRLVNFSTENMLYLVCAYILCYYLILFPVIVTTRMAVVLGYMKSCCADRAVVSQLCVKVTHMITVGDDKDHDTTVVITSLR